MGQGQKHSSQNASGKERRANPRYSIVLDAHLSNSGNGRRAVIIRDYCIGGLNIELIDAALLGVEESSFTLHRGDTLSVVTDVKVGNTIKQLNFNTKVIRIESDYIGLSFINPDLSMVQLLHKYAVAHKKPVTDDVSKNNFAASEIEYNGKPASQILSEAHRIVSDKLKPLMEQFHSSISEHFFEAAKETYDMAKQNALFESLGILEKNKNKITKAFTTFYEHKIKNYDPREILQIDDNEEEPEISLESLSLVEEDELDNWLSFSSIVRNIDADNRDELSKIERRSTVLYMAKIIKKNNPFGPAIFAQAFQEALEDVDIVHAVKLVCYTAFRDVYISIAEKLYKSINKYFIENDVLPKLKFKIDKSKKSSRSSSAASSQPEEEREFEEEGDYSQDFGYPVGAPIGAPIGAPTGAPTGAPVGQVQSRSAGQVASGAVRSGNPVQQNSVAGQPQPIAANPIMQNTSVAQEVSASQAGVTENNGNVPTAAENGMVPFSAGNFQARGREFVNTIHQQQPTGSTASQGVMEIFGDLRGLQQNISQVVSGVPNDQLSPIPTASSVPSSSIATNHFSPADLLDALSSQQLVNYDYASQSESNQSDFKEKIKKFLASKGIEGKVISEREEHVIDVASSVFSALMSDMQVAESIRPWIKQLEVPVLKMAIMDTKVFTDTSHVVRKVINKISDLEVLADVDNDEEQQAVRRAFDWLVKVINEDFDGTPKVFERIAQQLDILLKIQGKAFDKNLKNVVDDFIKEEKVTEDPQEKIVIDVDDEWARRVSRLEVADWLLFDAFSETPLRLKIGWIARRKGKYVFVNALGKKEKVLKLDELIELFKKGETVALDGVDDPAMDRAQYSMLQKLHNQLLFQSSHDQLTGLMNRREFETALQNTVDGAKIANTKHALCYIDLDKFSVINNSCGYEGGDALIKEISEILKKYLPEKGFLSRFSGDEFCMLLESHGTDEALEVVGNILNEIDVYRFSWDDKRLSIAMSIGLVIVKGHGEDIIKLILNAEASCGVAKEIGGHRIQVYNEGHARLNKHNAAIEWAAKIDKAIDDNALHLRCQRIMPLATDDSYHDHYEILLGMTDDLGEQSSLQEFIRAAENYKRMVDIDRWVIKTAFKWIADHRAELDHISSFSINLSGHSMNDPGLMDYVMKQMRDTGVPIGKICFEITETLGIVNLSDASDFIKRFKTTGCTFSLDDFGSGMSSYGYLKSLPVDYLKIDGIFVKDMATNPNDYAVVKSITEIGHFMGKKIIAEYVQDDETIQLLQDLGVDYAQGYGIEKPRLLDDLLL